MKYIFILLILTLSGCSTQVKKDIDYGKTENLSRYSMLKGNDLEYYARMYGAGDGEERYYYFTQFCLWKDDLPTYEKEYHYRGETSTETLYMYESSRCDKDKKWAYVNLRNNAYSSSMHGKNFSCRKSDSRCNSKATWFHYRKYPKTFGEKLVGFFTGDNWVNRYYFDNNQYKKAILSATKNERSLKEFREYSARINKGREKSYRHQKLREAEAERKASELKAASAFFERNRGRFRLGDKICNADNKFGYADIISGDNVKVISLRQGIDLPQYRMFSARGFEFRSKGMNSSALWDKKINWAHCSFN